MITAVMSPGAITTGLVLLALCGLALAFWGMSGERNPGPMFTTEPTVPGPGMCGCGAPKCTPQPAPFPGDEPAREKIPAPADAWPQVIPNPDDPTGLTFIPAPDGEGSPPASEKPAKPAEDTVWTRHEVREVWKRLRAEAGAS